MKKQPILRLVALLLLSALLCGACSSGDHMYKHRRSDCDCPTF